MVVLGRGALSDAPMYMFDVHFFNCYIFPSIYAPTPTSTTVVPRSIETEPLRNLQEDYAWGPMVVHWGGDVSSERGAPAQGCSLSPSLSRDSVSSSLSRARERRVVRDAFVSHAKGFEATVILNGRK